MGIIDNDMHYVAKVMKKFNDIDEIIKQHELINKTKPSRVKYRCVAEMYRSIADKYDEIADVFQMAEEDV